MSKASKLLIVESPAKIKTISKFLGPEFVIKSTFGHVKDLPARKLGITIDEKKHDIDFEYVPLNDKEKVIQEICRAAKGVSEVYLASDPDREGEIIAWHIGEEIAHQLPDKAKIYRITFNEITKPAVTEAIEHKSHVDMKKVHAQQARRALDRWVGYEVSPILWKKIKKGLSAGRVQSAALRLICDREEEIVNFKPQESWSIHGTFGVKRSTLVAELARINNKVVKLKNKEEADAVLAAAKKETYAVSDITEKKRLKNPVPPFMTSTLQQAAFNQLGFSVDKTMTIAQRLYEGLPLQDKNNPQALITYMRSDSLRLSDTAIKAGRGFIQETYGEKYLPKKTNVYAKGSGQDAHEAIRPIDVTLTPEFVANYLSSDEAKLYALIWKRFVACQMTPAEFAQQQISILGGKYLFRVTGSTLLFDGFLKVYRDEEQDEEDKNVIKIPSGVEKNMALPLQKVESKQHFTQPPPRFTEASLVKEMEQKGIGRPSTYAATLATIQKRMYTTKEKKRFMPTELGKSVNQMLQKNMPDIVDLQFTANMEEALDKIAQGTLERNKVLFDFYKKFHKDVVAFGGSSQKKEAVQTSLSCPLCGKPLVIRFGARGEFVGCSGFPTCTFTSNFIRNPDGSLELVQGELQESNLVCPLCGKKLVQRMGKFGPFLSCSGYPDCKYIHQETLEMPCPQDGGKLVKRRWKKGSFWGCSNYPTCNFAIFANVVETPCPKCKSPYLLVTKDSAGNEVHTCPNKECGYSKVIKS